MSVENSVKCLGFGKKQLSVLDLFFHYSLFVALRQLSS